MCELLQTIIKARSPLLAPGSMNVKLEEKKTDWSPMKSPTDMRRWKRNYKWTALLLADILKFQAIGLYCLMAIFF